ncbi:BTR1 [Symbiodinium natans]|uniref:BTR1 protein n=1 Tax=Symbiodinium natans TaxID=878477 RepID=A0A812QVE8_9DINO|nr:BTR1 [Symbiodinium natans]
MRRSRSRGYPEDEGRTRARLRRRPPSMSPVYRSPPRRRRRRGYGQGRHRRDAFRDDSRDSQESRDARLVPRNRSPREGAKTSHRILTVLPEEVGKVLGRKGETVRIIEKDSGAKVELDKAQGKVEIFGSLEEQDKALELLLAEVHWAQAEDGTVLKDEPRPKQRSGDEPELPPPVQLWVKDREAGRVIGRRGETVREVIEKSGADVKVQKSEEMPAGSKERQVQVIGTKEQQDEASTASTLRGLFSQTRQHGAAGKAAATFL